MSYPYFIAVQVPLGNPLSVSSNITGNVNILGALQPDGKPATTSLLFHPITTIPIVASQVEATLSASINTPATALVSPTIDFYLYPSYLQSTSVLARALTDTSSLIASLLSTSDLLNPEPSSIFGSTSYPAESTGSLSGSTSSLYTQSASATPSTGSLAGLTTTSGTGSASHSQPAASSSAPDATRTPIASQSNRHSTGEVVGVAIGCVIGGAVIAGIIFFVFLRRRTSRHHGRSPMHEKELSPLQPHGDAMIVNIGSSKAWGKHLPQSESDQTIRNSANGLLDHIEEYVDNFYSDAVNTHLIAGAQTELAALESDHLPEPVVSLIPRSRRPTALIKHCIAERVLSSISYDQNSTSFLPRDFTAIPMTTSRSDEPGFGAALSQWRVLTAHLKLSPEEDVVYHADRDKAILTMAQRLCRAFQPWARNDELSRLSSLIGVMKRASGFGVVLFSQPATFRWQWAEGADERQGVSSLRERKQLVVLPGLDKVTDGSATALSPPLQLLRPRMGQSL